MVLIFLEVSGLLVVVVVVQIILHQMEVLLKQDLGVMVQQLELHMLVLVMVLRLQLPPLLEMVIQLCKILDPVAVERVAVMEVLYLQVVVPVVPE
jgi:hypothetical protein